MRSRIFDAFARFAQVRRGRSLRVAVRRGRHRSRRRSLECCARYDPRGFERGQLARRGLASVNEFPDIPFHQIRDATDLGTHPDFSGADVALYHFGFYHPLFDVIAAERRSGPRQVVLFHNITPPELLPESMAPDIRRSFEQLASFT